MGGSDASIQFSHRKPPRPRLLLGIGLMLLALIGWAGTISTLTVAVSLCLAGLGATLARSGLPRRELTRIDVRSGMLTASLGSVRLEELSRIELRALSGDLTGHARPTYAAVAVGTDGRELSVLECSDPSELIGLGRAFEGAVRVTVGWAHDNPPLHAWLEAGKPESAPTHHQVRGRAFARQRKASLMTWIVALGLGITWAYFLVKAERPPSTLSLLLALGSLAFTFLTAALVTFDMVLVTLGREIHVERRIFGVTVRHIALDAGNVVRAAALTASNEGGHLLLVTRDDAIAVPLAEPAVHRVAELLSGA